VTSTTKRCSMSLPIHVFFFPLKVFIIVYLPEWRFYSWEFVSFPPFAAVLGGLYNFSFCFPFA